MSDMDAVNRQHVAAAGLNPDSLGQPSHHENQYLPGRCSALSPTEGHGGFLLRCARTQGHEGRHARGEATWGDQPEPTKQRPGDQPLPVVNDHPDIQAAVIADIEERRKVGISRYGTALQPNNGRDMLLDAYEEAMDLTIYLKGCLVERDLAKAAEQG